jgi:hypothetical protein
MGLQKEMQSVRKEIDAAQVFGQEQEVQESNVVVDAVASSLETVENAASAVANALTPPTEMLTSTLDACAVSAPTVDLSLPTYASGKK